MTDVVLTGAPPETTQKLLGEWSAHTKAADILDDLTPKQAMTKLEGWPYSIAEQVAHLLFWERYTHQQISTGKPPEVPSAALGWPAITQSDWPRVRDEFLEATEKSKELARNPETLNQPCGKNYTVGVALLQSISHHSYHLGQIALMRRLMGSWPPPSGGDTW
jgi:hypothetical protein